MRRAVSLSKIASLEKGDVQCASGGSASPRSGQALSRAIAGKTPLTAEAIFELLVDILSACYVYVCLAVRFWVPRHPAWDEDESTAPAAKDVNVGIDVDVDYTGGRSSRWEAVVLSPPNAIFNLNRLFKEDASPLKTNLGVGAFRDDQGRPVVLECVQRAEAAYQRGLRAGESDKEYLPIAGHRPMQGLAARLALGEAADAPGGCLAEGRVASVQSLSGTGALRLAADFLRRFAGGAPVLIPAETWANHRAILGAAGYTGAGDVRPYRYYCAATCALDFDGMMQDLEAAPVGAVVLLQAVAHNPTGVDPSRAQWERVMDVVQRRRLFPLFDNAYQGFATGDLEADAFVMRAFVARGLECMIAQSFSKNLGLYNERAGCLHVVCRTPESAARAGSQLELIVRAMYSNPPHHPAKLVELVLGTPELRALWQVETRGMADAIASRRRLLHDALVSNGTPSNAANGRWDHIVDQIGMFSYTGLTEAQCWNMEREHHVYMLKNGRVSMAGVCEANVAHVARAIHHSITGETLRQ
eukprot:g6887.t1